MKYGPCRDNDCRCGHPSRSHVGAMLDASVYEVFEETGGVRAICNLCDCTLYRPLGVAVDVPG